MAQQESVAFVSPNDLVVGTTLNINDECVGTITRDDGERIFIESDVFTGWATKEEIVAAMRSVT
jgi:hypothetical protein